MARGLHSFPTRRSSDLARLANDGGSVWPVHGGRAAGECGGAWPVGGSAPGRGRTRPAGCPLRSEEHTSELQSHHDLVCRLLLEKKNQRRRMLAAPIANL